MSETSEKTLDPQDWPALRAQGHRMLDDMFDYLEHLRERPVWQPAPPSVLETFQQTLPHEPSALEDVHASFLRDIVPYVIGNAHPGFMGWVQGGGTPVGMLSEMLAAGLNANVGGRAQVPVEVERQLLRWMRELFGFPDSASGLFVTGSSMANFISVLVARTAALGPGVRRDGVAADARRLCGYASAGAHGCIAQAMDMAGLGIAALHVIAVDADHRMDLQALQVRIAADRAAGFTPFFVAGTAGTVDTGAVDDLDGVAEIARREKLWFHVDGAFGALAMLAPSIAPRLRGIERADSIALDFHKWAQVQYDAGFILVRDGALHESTFAAPAAYLRRDSRGMAANSPWPCDFGPDLSRSFKALKTWFTFKVYGADQLGQVIAGTCSLAAYLGRRIAAEPRLELLAPVSLNIVCFAYRCEDADRINADLVVALQEGGVVAPSATTIDGRLAIRAAFVNHRTGRGEVDALIGSVLRLGAVCAAVGKATA